uniref:SGNH hydrolase-type esterase domain-containing protein n=1 Tax=Oryzias latipes TaxID=8090 RepID=A0A3P9GXA8_ORYLA
PGNPNSGESGRFPADLEQEKADAGLRDPALSSTPKLSWAEVTRRSRRSHGPKTDPSCSAKLALSNRYAPLAEDPGPTDAPTNQQDPPGLGLCQRRLTGPLPPGTPRGSHARAHSLQELQRRSRRLTDAAAIPSFSAAGVKRRRLLRDAVTRRSGEPFRGLENILPDHPLPDLPPKLHPGSLSVGHSAASQNPAVRDGSPAPDPGSAPRPVLILGDSMIRQVGIKRCHTHSISGASVKDIHNHLTSKPPSASTIIIHAGTNDIKFQQSETLKADFIHLIHHIQQLNLHCIISGPLPSPRYRDTKFSRIRQLHIWLKSYCHSLNIHYVDNFTTFYNRPNLFK